MKYENCICCNSVKYTNHLSPAGLCSYCQTEKDELESNVGTEDAREEQPIWDAIIRLFAASSRRPK